MNTRIVAFTQNPAWVMMSLFNKWVAVHRLWKITQGHMTDVSNQNLKALPPIVKMLVLDNRRVIVM